MFLTFKAGDTIRFPYKNHRGENAIREVIFHGIDYGSNEWYPEAQFFLRCYDPQKGARSFAIANIDAAQMEVVR